VGSYKGQAQLFSNWLGDYITYNGIQPDSNGVFFFTIPLQRYITLTELKGWNRTFNKYLSGYGYVLKKTKNVIEVTKQL